jgi:hypothetical protein
MGGFGASPLSCAGKIALKDKSNMNARHGLTIPQRELGFMEELLFSVSCVHLRV